MRTNLSNLALIAMAAAFSVHSTAYAQLPFQDRSLTPQERAADLTLRLTLEEKASLMIYDSPAIPRLGIPAYNWWNEALHGVARNGNATVYPMPIGMAAAFDQQLLHEVFTSVSDEARVKYKTARNGSDGSDVDSYWYKGLTFWTPNINIFRDPRWGRGMETYGEDPYLTGQLGMSVVRGLQGSREDGSIKAQACAKHFAVHSGPESSRHSFDAEVSERDLRETYLPAFKDLVTKAGVDEVMFAYNRFRGVPCGASDYLLKNVLCDEWGFKGLIVSDCWAVTDFYNGHGWVRTPEEAAAKSVLAGLDLECGQDMRALPDAVRDGLLSESDVNDRVNKILAVRFALGEIDFESPWDDVPDSALCSKSHSELALRMARESIVLLENDGTLPLSRDEKIALLGPNAADSVMLWGNYNGFPLHTVTLLEALQSKCPDLRYVPGCPYVEDSDSSKVDADAFLKGLEGYETVIFAGGISPSLEGEEMPVKVPGFAGGDRTTIELPQVQRSLVRALSAAGKKVIFVNFSGSAVALRQESEECAAILQAWYPGQAGGTAVADVLFGDVNPSGKLPVTFYTDDSQLPPFEDYAMKDRTYRYFNGEPLYPFGHGLSYTDFKFRRPRVKTLPDGSRALVVRVKNRGKRDGDEVVQLYVSRPDDADGPRMTLRGFQRVSVKAHKTVKVIIPLDEDTFVWWNEETKRMEPKAGEYVLRVGGTSAPSGQRALKVRK